MLEKPASLPTTALIPADTSESELISLWLRLKRSAHTRRAYGHAIEQYLIFLGKPLHSAVLKDALDFCETLSGADNSRRLAINAIKSFYSFACKSGLFPVNVMAAIKPPSAKSAIHKRLLSESVVINMIMQESNERNHCLLRLLYSAGLRVSELCDLTWEDVSEREHGGYIHVGKGKGDKERDIFLSADTWATLKQLRKHSQADAISVFVSRQSASKGRDGEARDKGQRIDTRTIRNIVKNAARRAGIPNGEQVSPHWLRHCHGTHAIRRGASLPVVRDTLGHSNLAITNVYAQTDATESSSRHLAI